MAIGWQVVVKYHQALMFRNGPYHQPGFSGSTWRKHVGRAKAGIGISAHIALPSL